jgi:hypothetical protein
LQPASVEYASPLKLFEYMALGRAIVAPAQPNIMEVLTDGADGVLFDPQDPAALANAIDRLCRDPSLRARARRCGSKDDSRPPDDLARQRHPCGQAGGGAVDRDADEVLRRQCSPPAGRHQARSAAMIRILTFSTLFPNNAQPSHGIFVETRLRHLLKSGEVEAKVVAPVPWFPSAHERFGHYGAFARVAGNEERGGLDIVTRATHCCRRSE